MTRVVEIAINAWLFGAPAAASVWAVTRLLHRAPARARYLAIVSGFFLTLLLPLIASVSGQNPIPSLELDRVETSRRLAPAAPAISTTFDAANAIATDAAIPLAIVWSIGIILLAARELAGHIAIARERRTWREAPVELRATLGWPAAVRLSVAPGVTPLTSGLILPRVLLPEDIVLSFPRGVARRIALHELAHYRWRDPLVYAVLRFIAIAFWIFPLWPLLQWLRREREVAADEAALRAEAGGEEHYAEALLAVSRAVVSHRTATASMAASDLHFRLNRILGAPQRSSIAVSLLILAASSVVASTIAPVTLSVDTRIVLRPAPAAAAVASPSAEEPAATPAAYAGPGVASTVRDSAALPVRRETPVPATTPSTAAGGALPAQEAPALPSSDEQPPVANPDTVHVNRHEDVTVHVDVREGDDAATITNAAVRQAVTQIVQDRGAARDDRYVIRVKSVIRTVDENRPSRLQRWLQKLRGDSPPSQSR